MISHELRESNHRPFVCSRRGWACCQGHLTLCLQCKQFLFQPLDYNLVHKQVSSYLIRNSKKTDSVIRKGTQRGTYCLNLNSEVFRQLQLQFDELQQEETSPASEEDTSLSLF